MSSKYRTLNCDKSSILNLNVFRLLNMNNLLSDRILEIISAGFTQSELSRAAGVTKGTSNQWIDGKIKSIKLEYAQGIQALTGFNASWIVTGKGNKHLTASAAQNPTTEHASPEIQAILNLLNATDERGKIKARLAVEDALSLHALILARTKQDSDDALSDAEREIIDIYRNAGKLGKSSIQNAASTLANVGKNSSTAKKISGN